MASRNIINRNGDYLPQEAVELVYKTSYTSNTIDFPITDGYGNYIGHYNMLYSMEHLNYNYANENIMDKINEFYFWLRQEEKDLREEIGADLSGILDKLEEIMSEINGFGDK